MLCIFVELTESNKFTLTEFQFSVQTYLHSSNNIQEADEIQN